MSRGEVGREARIGDRGRLHPDDLDALAAGEPGHRAEHRQPVVAVRIAARRRAARRCRARRSRRRWPRCRRRGRAGPSTTVAMRSDSLTPQLLRALDHGLALGEAAEQRDERQLVDRQRHLLGGHAACRASGAVRDLERAQRLGVGRRVPRAPPARRRRRAPMRSRMRKKPTRVQFAAMPSIIDPRAGDEHRRGGVEGGRGGVAGDVDRVERERVAAGDARRASPSRRMPAPGAGEQPLGVVAARLRLDDRRRPRRPAARRAARSS